MTKRQLLKSKGIEIHNFVDSLFERGGTMQEDYIIVKGEKIGLSQLKEFKMYRGVLDKVLNGGDKDIVGGILYTITDDLFIIINQNGLTYRKIKINSEYIYDFLKTIVKTRNIDELKKHFKEANDSDGIFNNRSFHVLARQE